MSKISTWLKQIDRVRHNPGAIQRLTLAKIQEATENRVDIVDATSPFAFLLEAVSVNAAACMQEAESLTRRLYPVMAVTEDELYLHMSDADYVGRFATPSRTTFTLQLNKNEVMARSVQEADGLTSRIVIPKDTVFKVSGIEFTMQYPIIIRRMPHGGLQITYDLSKPGPLETLASNVVDWTLVRINGDEYIMLTIPVQQFTRTTQTGTVTLSSGYEQSFSYTDAYCMAEVRVRRNGVWELIRTTHTDQVFDSTVLTAVLKVLPGQLVVSIPQIYLSTGRIDSDIRVDILTTKGPMDMILSNITINEFTVEWRELDATPESSRYTAPLTNLKDMAVYSADVVTGGTRGLTFRQLRDRVLQNTTGQGNIPISNAQLTTRLQDMGYLPVRDVDNITNRQFLATRQLPPPGDGSVVAGAGTAIQTLIASMDELTSYATVIDNGDRITITPQTLYHYLNGTISIVPDVTVSGLLSLSADVRARRINADRYLYSPFHYVLDMTEQRFDHRAYHLNSPQVLYKSFLNENEASGFQISTQSYEVVRTDEGYALLVVSKSGDSWKGIPNNAIWAQLSFVPVGEKERAYLNGTLVGLTDDNERVYRFELTTNFDIDAQGSLSLTSFQMYDDEPRIHASVLEGDFELTWLTSADPLNANARVIHAEDVGFKQIPENAYPVSRESFRIRLGQDLDGLWSRSRSVASSLDYARHSADVPAVYEKDVYKRDPVTGAIEITIKENNELEYTILHRAGDPMMDEDGNPIYRARAGDPILDADGNVQVTSSRKMLRQVDLMLVDGVYFFATDPATVAYAASIPATVASWVRNDIRGLSRKLLDRTWLYFYPRASLGYIQAIVGEDEQRRIWAEQSFSVVFYLSGPAFRDAALKKSLTQTAIATLASCLDAPVVSMNRIIQELTTRTQGDVMGVSVKGLGGDIEAPVITLIDDSVRLSLRKIAVAQPDNTIRVTDDVSVGFAIHTD